MDAFIFPAQENLVLAYQGLLDGGQYLQCESCWKMVKKAWYNYPLDKVARAFVHHAQVAAAIYACEGGDKFVKEINGLSFRVKKVCYLFDRDNYKGDDDNTTDLSTLRSVEDRIPLGVIVDNFTGIAMLDEQKLKYPLPNINTVDICEALSHAKLKLIARNIDDVGYNNFPADKQARPTSLSRHGIKN